VHALQPLTPIAAGTGELQKLEGTELSRRCTSVLGTSATGYRKIDGDMQTDRQTDR